MLAIFGALIIGMSLGLLGSGGSLLTVPVLIFIMNQPEKLAIAESLAIVGSIAFIGSLPYAIRAQIHWKSVLFFGLPGMLGSYLGACGSYYISDTIQLILFALMMFLVSGVMIFGPTTFEKFITMQYSIWRIVLEGFIIGCLTGLLGVGGGFLIVPALILFSHMSMFFAIGTSLVIITMNSFIGFIEQLIILRALQMEVNWEIIGIIALVGSLGSFSGSFIAKRFSQFRLRQGFGISVLFMGTYILLKEL